MKTTVFAICILCATGALGQSVGSVLSNQAQPFQMPDHAMRAYQRPLATEQNLLETSGLAYAQGERPLWEFAPAPNRTPLGDIARLLKKEHTTAKKANKVWSD